MRAIQIQQPFFQRAKSFTYANQISNIKPNFIKPNISLNLNGVNPINTTTKIIPNNNIIKRYQSPIPGRVDGIGHVKTFTKNIVTNNLLNSTIQNHNPINIMTKSQNIVNNSTIKSLNYMNPMLINQNPINNQNKINGIIPNPTLIINNNLTNQSLINNQALINNIKRANIPNPTIINNVIGNPVNKPNFVNGILPNQNMINPIKPAPVNLSYIPNVNQLGNGINNKINLSPGMALGGQQVIPQNLPNNNILQLNNLREPSETINLMEFKVVKEIGEGTFGKIYQVIWIVNNKVYALKKEILSDLDGVKVRQHRNETIKNFIKNTNCLGVVKLYGNLTIPMGNQFQYYELMELCERDFEQEIKARSSYNRFYTEAEMHGVMLQLISTLSFLQKNHITHRDIKPQNILISNGIYKLCDFGDIRIMKRDGIVVQRVRGSELYMSPILFNGLRAKAYQVRHNTYKSDVFSLGMCFLLAACLSYDGLVEIRELADMNQKEMILNKYLGRRYSQKLIKILLLMLQTEEVNRPDFITLENAIRQYGL